MFGGARLDLIDTKKMRTTFADIAGIEQVKAELMELVTFLRDPERFLRMGARSPAGVLLVGPPGEGPAPAETLCTMTNTSARPELMLLESLLHINMLSNSESASPCCSAPASRNPGLQCKRTWALPAKSRTIGISVFRAL